MSASSTPLYDLSYLRSLSEDPAFLENMIHLYLKATPELVEALRMAIADNDAEAQAKALHKLKSAAAAIGMDATKLEIETVEKLLKNGNSPSVGDERLAAIATAFDHTLEALTRKLH